MNDELLATTKVQDLEREAAALYRNRLQKPAKNGREPRDQPPLSPPLPLHLAKEYRQTF